MATLAAVVVVFPASVTTEESTCELVTVLLAIIDPVMSPVQVLDKFLEASVHTGKDAVRAASLRFVFAVIVVPVIAAGVVPPIAPGDGNDEVEPPSDTEVPAIVMAELVKPPFGSPVALVRTSAEGVPRFGVVITQFVVRQTPPLPLVRPVVASCQFVPSFCIMTGTLALMSPAESAVPCHFCTFSALDELTLRVSAPVFCVVV